MPSKVVLAAVVALGLVASPAVRADDRFIVLASTTSTENSGLLGEILPVFTKRTGIAVRVVAVGTGQAIRLAEKGDVDLLLVHHPESERAFVEAGHGVARHEVMYNDFVIVGPSHDPAGARGGSSLRALRSIAAGDSLFLSRGDDSGTHKKELSLWAEAGIDPRPHSGGWYRETGSGQGATLNTAHGLQAYTLSDRGTWLRFASKGDLGVLVEGDEALFNPYGIILVNPERHAHVKADEAQAFIDWLLSDEGQRAIASFRIDGQQAFFPSARERHP
ncbi:MAG: extracellular solute-binding protein [Myxococcota bacterium]|nr:extracellular solute-binding protein [Myxococcota bacterium]